MPMFTFLIPNFYCILQKYWYMTVCKLQGKQHTGPSPASGEVWEDRHVWKPPLPSRCCGLFGVRRRPLHKVVKQQYKHDSEKWGHKEVIHEPVPHQWAGKRLPHMSPGGRGHSVAVFSKVFPEQVDGFWIPLHPGLLSGPAWSPFT